MALPVVGKRRHLSGRFGNPAELFGVLGRILAHSVLVDVVTEVNHRIEIVLSGNVAIHVEIACGMIRAAHDREPRGGYGAGRQGPRTAHRGAGVIDLEAIEVRRSRREAAHVGLHGVIGPVVRPGNAVPQDLFHVRVARNQPSYRQRAAGRPADPRPQDETVAQRIAARDAVLEAQRIARLRAAGPQASQRCKDGAYD